MDPSSSSSPDQHLPRTTFLSLPDELIVAIGDSACSNDFVKMRWSFYEDEFDCSNGTLLRLILTCRRLWTLLLPMLWRSVMITDSDMAFKVLKALIRRTETRQMVKRLYCHGADAPEVHNMFLRLLPELELGRLEELALEASGFDDHASLLWNQGQTLPLRSLNLVKDHGFQCGRGFRDSAPALLQRLSLGPLRMPQADEVLRGLDQLKRLCVKLDAESEVEVTLTTLRVVENYLGQLEEIVLWGYDEDLEFHNPAVSHFLEDHFLNVKKITQKTYPKLHTFKTNCLLLFQRYADRPTTPFTSLCKLLLQMPNLRHITFDKIGEFVINDDEIALWEPIQLRSTISVSTSLFEAGEEISESQSLLGTTYHLKGVVAFTKLFPSLRYLDLSDCYSTKGPSQALGNASSFAACGLISPSFLVLLTTLLESKVVSVRVDSLHVYRKNASVRERERSLMHDF